MEISEEKIDKEGKTFSEFAESLLFASQDDSTIETYKLSFDELVKRVEPEDILAELQKRLRLLHLLAPLYAGSLVYRHQFSEALEFTSDVIAMTHPFSDLVSKDAQLLKEANEDNGIPIGLPIDFCIGRLLKYYYLSLKYQGLNADVLYRHLSIHKVLGHEYTVSVLTNCILDYQINNNIYQDIVEKMVDSQEEARNCFYRGYIAMVVGEYKKALEFFSKADILNKSKSTEFKIKKCTIVCKLLLSDFTIFYPYQIQLRPYFCLIGAVKRAESDNFREILEEYKEEFFSLNLYFIIRRMAVNVVREGLRRISVSYSRIYVNDISKMLGFDADYLIHSTIRSGFIKGYVEDGVFYSTHRAVKSFNLGERIRNIVGVRNSIIKMMKYPPIVPLTFESMICQEHQEDIY